MYVSLTVMKFYTDNTPQLCPYDGATLTISNGNLNCPPAYLTCLRNTPIASFDSTTNIPPSCKYSVIRYNEIDTA